MKIGPTAATALLALICDCLSASAGTVLWRNIEAGMTPDQVREVAAAAGWQIDDEGDQFEIEDVRITDDCEAEAIVHFEEAVVSRIVLRGEGSMAGRCADRVFSALVAKYGEPKGKQETSQNLFRREASVSIWNREGVNLTFKNHSNGGMGGGLAVASWTLTYIAALEDVNL